MSASVTPSLSSSCFTSRENSSAACSFRSQGNRSAFRLSSVRNRVPCGAVSDTANAAVPIRQYALLFLRVVSCFVQTSPAGLERSRSSLRLGRRSSTYASNVRTMLPQPSANFSHIICTFFCNGISFLFSSNKIMLCFEQSVKAELSTKYLYHLPYIESVFTSI